MWGRQTSFEDSMGAAFRYCERQNAGPNVHAFPARTCAVTNGALSLVFLNAAIILVLADLFLPRPQRDTFWTLPPFAFIHSGSFILGGHPPGLPARLPAATPRAQRGTRSSHEPTSTSWSWPKRSCGGPASSCQCARGGRSRAPGGRPICTPNRPCCLGSGGSGDLARTGPPSVAHGVACLMSTEEVL